MYMRKEKQNIRDGKNNRIESKHREKLNFAVGPAPIFNSILKTIENLT